MRLDVAGHGLGEAPHGRAALRTAPLGLGFNGMIGNLLGSRPKHLLAAGLA